MWLSFLEVVKTLDCSTWIGSGQSIGCSPVVISHHSTNGLVPAGYYFNTCIYNTVSIRVYPFNLLVREYLLLFQYVHIRCLMQYVHICYIFNTCLSVIVWVREYMLLFQFMPVCYYCSMCISVTVSVRAYPFLFQYMHIWCCFITCISITVTVRA